jgi:hypothetical protein
MQSITGNVVPFIPGHRPLSDWDGDPIDPIDGAVFDVECAAQDIATVIARDIRTVDEALVLRRRIAALIVVLEDVEVLALVRANQLCR